jgi:tetratricopeptide (TPR) repeat protein
VNSLVPYTICLVLLSGVASSVAQSPASRIDHRQNAIAYQQAGKFAEAAEEWREFLKTHPQNTEAYADLGINESRQEHYKEAIPAYRKALALNPKLNEIRLNLGLAYFKSAELKEAIQAFTPLLSVYPPNSLDHLRVGTLIGMSHFSLGEFAAAIPFLRTAANSDPQNIIYRFSLAQSCLFAHQYQCVLDNYQDLLKLNAESAAADMLAGQAYDEMKNTNGAIEQFRAAVKADPKWPEAHFGLGYLLWTQNQCDEASKEFEAELANVPDHARAMTFLADCKIQLGHTGDAQPLIEKALKIDPGIAKAHADLGLIYQEQGKQEDALRELTTAVKMTPQDANIHWRLARLYQSMGRREEAKAEFDKTSSLHKAENDSVFKQLKSAQQNNGSTEDATSASPAKQ